MTRFDEQKRNKVNQSRCLTLVATQGNTVYRSSKNGTSGCDVGSLAYALNQQSCPCIRLYRWTQILPNHNVTKTDLPWLKANISLSLRNSSRSLTRRLFWGISPSHELVRLALSALCPWTGRPVCCSSLPAHYFGWFRWSLGSPSLFLLHLAHEYYRQLHRNS